MEQVRGAIGRGDRTILVVDDDPDTCLLLEMLIRMQGFTPRIASSGYVALQVAQTEKLDAILLDVMMPEMDGWETFQQLREVTQAPVLFLTALSSGESAAKALILGAKDYIRKPFHNEELIARLWGVFNGYGHPDPIDPLNTLNFQRPLVSLVIPTLNEAENLPLVLPYLPMNWIDEVILVDGLSTDGTVAVAKKLLPSIRILLETKRGKGAALRTGYMNSKGDVIIVLDADGSNDPREIPRFIRALMGGADLVKGSRFAHGGGTTDMPRVRQLGNKFFVFLVNLIFNVHFTDLCYGYHAFWRYCLDQVELEDVEGFEIDTAIYVRSLCHRLRVTEVPSFEGYRFRGEGKLRSLPDGWRVLVTILRETIHNLRFPDKTVYEGFRGQQPNGDFSASTSGFTPDFSINKKT